MPGVEKAAAAVLGGSVPPQPGGGGAKASASGAAPCRFATPPAPPADSSSAGGGPEIAERGALGGETPTWETFNTLCAFDSFRAAWLENERLIEEAAQREAEQYGPKWKPGTEDEVAEYLAEQRIARHLYDEIMAPFLRGSCVVILQGMVERELRRMIENLENQRGKPPLELKEVRASSVLEQTTKYLELFFSVRLEDCPQLAALGDLQRTRDRIVRCRAERSRDVRWDREERIRVKHGQPGLLAAMAAELEVEPACLERFVTDVREFFVWVFRKLNWKIDGSWQDRTRTEPWPGTGTARNARAGLE